MEKVSEGIVMNLYRGKYDALDGLGKERMKFLNLCQGKHVQTGLQKRAMNIPTLAWSIYKFFCTPRIVLL